MRYRQVGSSGLTVSVLGLGTRLFGRECDAETASRVVDAAIDAGITLIDTAHSYGEGESERVLGQALRGKRERVVISTKFGSRRQRQPDLASGSRRAIRIHVEEALGRLETDYIDLYHLHFPDPATPIEETLRALTDLVAAGKVRYIGSSNFAAWQIVEADWAARLGGGERFVAAQREYNILDRGVETEVLPICDRYGVGLLAWRALGDGLLTPRDDRSDPRLGALDAFAAERSISLSALAIGAVLATPGVAAALTGARSDNHIRDNATASDWIPTADDLAALRAVLDGPAGAPAA
jgi:aryl-alcohol dehydrogenase-like predicted oxidoreductase